MFSSDHPQPLAPSDLGTKEYWNTLYTRELRNHATDPSDTGTCWFDDADAASKMITYLASLDLPPSPSVLDLGCGNGEMLRELRRQDGFGASTLRGVDYAPQSIELARACTDDDDIDYVVWDVLDGSLDDEGILLPAGGKGDRRAWDVVTDKGTFDAVSLAGGTASEAYPLRVAALLGPRGVFLVTSCNWTENELRSWFSAFRVVGKVEHRTFRFGGVQGQNVSTLCFSKT